jgi:hypothetical protein
LLFNYFLLQLIFTRIEFLTTDIGGAECRDVVIVGIAFVIDEDDEDADPIVVEEEDVDAIDGNVSNSSSSSAN